MPPVLKPTQGTPQDIASITISQEGKLILFGSVKITDKRKGIDYLIEACKLLAEKHNIRKRIDAERNQVLQLLRLVAENNHAQ